MDRNQTLILLVVAQVGEGLLEGFGGRAVHLVHAADRSAARLVALLAATFPGFRDHCIYKCGVSLTLALA